MTNSTISMKPTFFTQQQMMLNFEFDMDHENEYLEYVGTDYVCA